MGDLISLSEPPIKPVHWQRHPNESIDLGTVAVRFAHKGQTRDRMAKVALRFAPDDRLSFVVSTEENDPFFAFKFFVGNAWDGKLTLIDRGLTIDAYCA